MGRLGERGVHRGDEIGLWLGLNSRECLRKGGGGFTLWRLGKAGHVEGFGGHVRGGWEGVWPRLRRCDDERVTTVGFIIIAAF